MSTHDAGRPGQGLVSIIVPARNAAPWIGEALGSALAQSYRPLEIIVVDNGSTDDTVGRTRAFSGRGVALCVVAEGTPGPSAARNAGLAAARGEFVQFLDADDALRPGKIAAQHRWLAAGGGDVVWGAFRRVQDGALALLEQEGHLAVPRIGDDVEAGLISPDGFLHLGATLIRRSAIGDARFDTRVRVVEDVRFLFELARAGARFVRQDAESGYLMREHAYADRASRVATTEFADSCAGLARMAEERWVSEGALTEERRLVLARILVGAAGSLVRVDPGRARAALARARELTPRYYEAFPADWRPLVRTVGFERAERLAGLVRRVRRAMGLGRA